MRQLLSVIVAASVLGLLVQPSLAQEKSGSPLVGKPLIKKIAEPVEPPADSCGKFGTSVEFVSTPSEAARQALKEEKLVFVLHVSGDFETPEFT